MPPINPVSPIAAATLAIDPAPTPQVTVRTRADGTVTAAILPPPGARRIIPIVSYSLHPQQTLGENLDVKA